MEATVDPECGLASAGIKGVKIPDDPALIGKDEKVNTLVKLTPNGGPLGSLGSVDDLIPAGSRDFLGGEIG